MKNIFTQHIFHLKKYAKTFRKCDFHGNFYEFEMMAFFEPEPKYYAENSLEKN